MPRRNGTGPMGMGSTTGLKRGYCRSGRYGVRRISFGNSYGRGVGRCVPWADYTTSPDEEKALLENERTFLRSRLKEIEDIIENIDESQK